MIRCYPVDGTSPFEVENDAFVDRFDGGEHIISTASAIASWAPNVALRWTPRSQGRPVVCRIESWRERAERLKMEAPRFTWDEKWDFNRKSGRLGTLATVYVYRRDHRFQPDTPQDRPTHYAPGAKDMSGVLRNPADPRGDLEYATEDEAKRAAEAMVMLAMRTDPT